jgi:hypothetical protein
MVRFKNSRFHDITSGLKITHIGFPLQDVFRCHGGEEEDKHCRSIFLDSLLSFSLYSVRLKASYYHLEPIRK